jgi:DNA-binding NarL/FixJ family response regulator
VLCCVLGGRRTKDQGPEVRILIVGLPGERERLRHAFIATGVDVAGEFATLAEARASALVVDAIVVSPAREQRAPDNEPLTPRELEVLERLIEGLSNKAIAARLGISDQTVKFHVAAICGKLGAVNRTDAVRRAIRRGLVAV